MMRKVFSLICFVCLSSLSLHASLLSLSQHDISSDSDILNDGTFVSANSFGSSPIPGTINGVTFGTNQSGLGNFVNGGGDFAAFTPGSGLDNVLSNLVFTGNFAPGTFTLNGLDTSKTYRLQLLFSNILNGTGHNQRINFMGGSIDILNMGSRAINVVAEFSPNSSSEVVSIHHLTHRTVFNGYALHEMTAVPEPSTYALLALGLLGLGVTRRKMKK